MRRIAFVVLLAVGACRGEAPAPAGGSAPEPARPSASSVAQAEPPSGAPMQAGAGTAVQEQVLKLVGPGTIQLEPGSYDFAGTPEEDPSCATCMDEDVDAVKPIFTRGLRVSGKGITVRGAGADTTILRTRAGVGVLFDGCEDCVLEGVTVTGCERDLDRRALDAAVVVRNSRVTLKQCVLKDNVGTEKALTASVAGICGVAVREGGFARIEGCRIERSSWDGITVVRGASAVIEGNLVDGVDKATLQQAGGGRTSGVNVAWDGEATLKGNLIRRCDMGVSISGDARIVMSENVIEDVRTFGVGVRSGDVGRPSVVIDGNAVFRVSGCGIVIRAPAPIEPDVLRVVGNAIALTGLSGVAAACPPIAIEAPAVGEISGNAFHRNEELGGAPGRNDVDAREWTAQVKPLVLRLDAWPILHESQFLQAFRRQ